MWWCLNVVEKARLLQSLKMQFFISKTLKAKELLTMSAIMDNSSREWPSIARVLSKTSLAFGLTKINHQNQFNVIGPFVGPVTKLYLCSTLVGHAVFWQ
jgi:hypothetical protein